MHERETMESLKPWLRNLRWMSAVTHNDGNNPYQINLTGLEF